MLQRNESPWIATRCCNICQFMSTGIKRDKKTQVSQDLEIHRQFFSSHNWLKTSHIYIFAGGFWCFPYLTNVSSVAGFFSICSLKFDSCSLQEEVWPYVLPFVLCCFFYAGNQGQCLCINHTLPLKGDDTKTVPSSVSSSKTECSSCLKTWIFHQRKQ